MSQSVDHNSDVMTIKEAAAYLRVSERTMYDLANDGKVPSARVGNGHRFSRSALDEWLRKGGNRSGEARPDSEGGDTSQSASGLDQGSRDRVPTGL